MRSLKAQKFLWNMYFSDISLVFLLKINQVLKRRCKKSKTLSACTIHNRTNVIKKVSSAILNLNGTQGLFVKIPRGGLFFRLASANNSEKNPAAYRAFS